MDFMMKLNHWLGRHPLKEPPETDRAQFTERVMARVQASQAPARASAWGFLSQPRFALGIAMAAAVVAVAFLAIVPQSGKQVAVAPEPAVTESAPEAVASLPEQTADEVALLAAVNGLDLDALPEGDVEVVAEEMQLIEQIMLAQQVQESSDEEWLEQSLYLFEQLEEEIPTDTSGNGSESEWLEELRLLDELDLASS